MKIQNNLTFFKEEISSQYEKFFETPSEDTTPTVQKSTILNIDNYKEKVLGDKEPESTLLEIKIDRSISGKLKRKNSKFIFIGKEDEKALGDSLAKKGILAEKKDDNTLIVRKMPLITNEQYDKLEKEYIYKDNENVLGKLYEYLSKVNCNYKSRTCYNSVGGINPLTYLIEQSFHMNFHRKKEMEEKFTLLRKYMNNYREINGDGNCYYRAVMFRYIEILILTKNIPMFQRFIYDVIESFKSQEIQSRRVIRDNDIKPELTFHILFLILNLLKKKGINESHQIFVKCISTCKKFDFCLILYFRYILYKYIKQNENKIYTEKFPVKIGNLLPQQYENEKGEFLFDSFYENYLLKFFTDAEKIIIYITPFVLGIEVNVVVYDIADEEIFQQFVWEGESDIKSKDVISLLNNKNHYAIIYNEYDNKTYKKKFEFYESNIKSVVLMKSLAPNIVNYEKDDKNSSEVDILVLDKDINKNNINNIQPNKNKIQETNINNKIVNQNNTIKINEKREKNIVNETANKKNENFKSKMINSDNTKSENFLKDNNNINVQKNLANTNININNFNGINHHVNNQINPITNNNISNLKNNENIKNNNNVNININNKKIIHNKDNNETIQINKRHNIDNNEIVNFPKNNTNNNNENKININSQKFNNNINSKDKNNIQTEKNNIKKRKKNNEDHSKDKSIEKKNKHENVIKNEISKEKAVNIDNNKAKDSQKNNKEKKSHRSSTICILCNTIRIKIVEGNQLCKNCFKTKIIKKYYDCIQNNEDPTTIIYFHIKDKPYNLEEIIKLYNKCYEDKLDNQILLQNIKEKKCLLCNLKNTIPMPCGCENCKYCKHLIEYFKICEIKTGFICPNNVKYSREKMFKLGKQLYKLSEPNANISSIVKYFDIRLNKNCSFCGKKLGETKYIKKLYDSNKEEQTNHFLIKLNHYFCSECIKIKQTKNFMCKICSVYHTDKSE